MVRKFLHVCLTVFGVLALNTAAPALGESQDDDMVWQFRQAEGSAGVGRKSAGLVFGVPETDHVQVQAGCDSSFANSGNSISLVVGADVGNLKDGDDVLIKFKGGKFRAERPGKVHGTKLEVGVTGAHIQLAPDDDLWRAMQERDALNYEIDGYRRQRMKLQGGASTIQRFVAMCGDFVEANRSKPNSSSTTQVADSSASISSETISEKEAFDSAKELNTIEGWEAFLNNFPTGYRADLARAYVRRIGRQTTSPAPSNTSPPKQEMRTETEPKQELPLDTYESRAGSSPWRTIRYEMDEGNASAQAAAVKANGVELLFHCTGRKLFGVLRASERNLYPNFDRRIEQGLKANQRRARREQSSVMDIEFANGRQYAVNAAVMGLTGEVAIERRGGGGFSAGETLIEDIMKNSEMTVSAPPFVAHLQLKDSRDTMCSVVQSCGARAPGCEEASSSSVRQDYKPEKTYKPKKKKRQCKKVGGRCSRNNQCCSGSCCQDDFEQCEGWYGKCL